MCDWPNSAHESSLQIFHWSSAYFRSVSALSCEKRNPWPQADMACLAFYALFVAVVLVFPFRNRRHWQFISDRFSHICHGLGGTSPLSPTWPPKSWVISLFVS